jgi:hypothetical protein
MRNTVGLLAVCLVPSLCIADSFSAKQDFTLNPDGFGKLSYQMSMSPPDSDAAKDPAALKEAARAEAAKIVKESKGVAAWKDVTFTAEKDGKITFKGTAFFQDVAELKLGGSTQCSNALKYTCATADAAAQLELIVQMQEEPAPTEAPKLTEEEIKKKIADARADMAKALRMFEEFVGNELQMEYSFTLPGPVVKGVNFQPVADKPNTVRAVFEGKKMLELMKALSEDEAYMRAKIVAGKDPTGLPAPELFNEKLFGTKGPITVSFKPGDKPLFDFAAESEAAKKAMPDLDLDKPAARAPN